MPNVYCEEDFGGVKGLNSIFNVNNVTEVKNAVLKGCSSKIAWILIFRYCGQLMFLVYLITAVLETEIKAELRKTVNRSVINQLILVNN